MNKETFERFEKYRVAYVWADDYKDVNATTRQRFGRWFAYSDWDDPAPAWREFLDIENRERVGK